MFMTLVFFQDDEGTRKRSFLDAMKFMRLRGLKLPLGSRRDTSHDALFRTAHTLWASQGLFKSILEL